jgi:hypothetical protein
LEGVEACFNGGLKVLNLQDVVDSVTSVAVYRLRSCEFGTAKLYVYVLLRSFKSINALILDSRVYPDESSISCSWFGKQRVLLRRSFGSCQIKILMPVERCALAHSNSARLLHRSSYN